MDGLSLLCNLHSDGPLALRRLRAAGVRELSALEDVPEAVLTGCLRSSVAHARRFVEEARQLARRLAESPLEPEPADPGASSGEGDSRAELVDRHPSLAWAVPSTARVARVPAGEHALEPEILEGLDARACERLAREGVLTLEALQERAGLALARTAGIPLAKLLDLAALARLATKPGAGERRAETKVRDVVLAVPHRSIPRRGGPAVPPGHAAGAAAGSRVSEPGVAGPFG